MPESSPEGQPSPESDLVQTQARLVENYRQRRSDGTRATDYAQFFYDLVTVYQAYQVNPQTADFPTSARMAQREDVKIKAREILDERLNRYLRQGEYQSGQGLLDMIQKIGYVSRSDKEVAQKTEVFSESRFQEFKSGFERIKPAEALPSPQDMQLPAPDSDLSAAAQAPSQVRPPEPAPASPAASVDQAQDPDETPGVPLQSNLDQPLFGQGRGGGLGGLFRKILGQGEQTASQEVTNFNPIYDQETREMLSYANLGFQSLIEAGLIDSSDPLRTGLTSLAEAYQKVLSGQTTGNEASITFKWLDKLMMTVERLRVETEDNQNPPLQDYINVVDQFGGFISTAGQVEDAFINLIEQADREDDKDWLERLKVIGRHLGYDSFTILDKYYHPKPYPNAPGEIRKPDTSTSTPTSTRTFRAMPPDVLRDFEEKSQSSPTTTPDPNAPPF